MSCTTWTKKVKPSTAWTKKLSICEQTTSGGGTGGTGGGGGGSDTGTQGQAIGMLLGLTKAQ